MIEIIVAYLVAAVGSRVGSRVIDPLLDRLIARVRDRLGNAPVDDLRREPDDENARNRLVLALEREVATNAAFAADLADLRVQLDRAGGRVVVENVNAPVGSLLVGSNPTVVHGDYVQGQQPPKPVPSWVRQLTLAGVLIAFAGVLTFFIALAATGANADDSIWATATLCIAVVTGLGLASIVQVAWRLNRR
jgi:hypothetical protein